MTSASMENYIRRPFDPDRKRYYIVDADISRSFSDFSILNEEEFILNRKWAGHITIKEYAGKRDDGTNRYYGGLYGLPELYAKPKIKVGLKNSPLDAYAMLGITYISTQAKLLLERIDPDAFEFAECDTISRKSIQVEPYWMMMVKRVVSRFDESRSVFREVGGNDPRPVPSGQSVGIRDLYEMRMPPDFPDSHHAFHLIKYSRGYIFDEVIVDEWRHMKLTGLLFSPLQPPMKSEEKMWARYINKDYFWKNYRHLWEDLV